MAVIKLSGLATSIVGKMGGSVFQNSTYGTIMKNNRFKRSRQNPLNFEKRSMFAYLANLGRSLTDAQRTAKTNSGALVTRPTKQGPDTPYDWWSFHMAFNANLLLCGLPLNLGGWDVPEMPDVSLLSVGPTEGSTNWDITGSADIDEGYHILIFASAPTTDQSSFRQGRMKLLDIKPTDGTTLSFSKGDYITMFGSISAGTPVWFQLRIVEDTTGYSSLPKITKADAQ